MNTSKTVKIRDLYGIEHDAKLISYPNAPYLEYEYKVVQKMYNPNYGDDRKCKCGHPYYRHFDFYEYDEACGGCKYCECEEFVEDTQTSGM